MMVDEKVKSIMKVFDDKISSLEARLEDREPSISHSQSWTISTDTPASFIEPKSDDWDVAGSPPEVLPKPDGGENLWISDT